MKKNTPQLGEALRGSWRILTTGPAVKKPTISPKNGRRNWLQTCQKLCAIRSPLVYRRVPVTTPTPTSFNIFITRFLYLTSADTPKNPVPERSGSTSEELLGKPAAFMKQKTEKHKEKMKDAKKYRAIHLHDLTGLAHRSFREKFWLMKSSPVAPRGKPCAQGSILPQLFSWITKCSREQTVGNRARVSTVIYNHFPKGPKTATSAWRTKMTRGSCRRHAGTVRAKSGKLLGEKNDCGSQSSQWRKWKHANNHRYAVVVGKISQHRGYNPTPVQKLKTSQQTQKSQVKFLEADEEAQSFWPFLWRTILGIIVRQRLHRSEKWGLLKEQCAEWKKGTCCSIVCNQVWIEKWWGGIPGVLLLSAKHTRSLVWWEKTPYERAVRNALNRTCDYRFGAMVEKSPFFCERHRGYINLKQKSCQVYFSVMQNSPTLVRNHPDRGEETRNSSRWNSGRVFLQPYFKTHRCMMVKAGKWFLVSGDFYIPSIMWDFE